MRRPFCKAAAPAPLGPECRRMLTHQLNMARLSLINQTARRGGALFLHAEPVRMEDCPIADADDALAPDLTGAPAAPRPLGALDDAMAALFALPPRTLTQPGETLAPGITLQFRGDSGLRAGLGGGDGFAVTLHDRGDSPWFSLEMVLPTEAVRTCRFLGLRVAGHCIAGAVTLRPVLRLMADDGWHDAEFGRDLAFTSAHAENLALLSLDGLAGRETAVAATLILFLRQRATDLRLTRIDPFCAH
ncbi:MAG: hypothetical protein ACI95R_001815 [Halioglobus sp.]|jgi:hypothetical protein